MANDAPLPKQNKSYPDAKINPQGQKKKQVKRKCNKR